MSEGTDHDSLTASYNTCATASNDGPLDLGSPPCAAWTTGDDPQSARLDGGAGECGHGSPDLVVDEGRPLFINLEAVELAPEPRRGTAGWRADPILVALVVLAGFVLVLGLWAVQGIAVDSDGFVRRVSDAGQ